MTASSYFNPRFIRTVWPLAVAETLMWASLYYVFPALLPRWEQSFDWSRAELTGAFTLALLASACCAPFSGVLIDRGKGRRNMVIGTVIGALLLALMSRVESIVMFYALWFAMGVVHSVTLYEPCFAILTRIFANNAKKAITVVTLLAGLAGSVSFPTAHLISEHYGWRSALMVFAVITLVCAAIVYWSLDPADEPRQGSRTDRKASGGFRVAMAKPIFWLLAIGFSFLAINHGAIISHLLLILDERGIEIGLAVVAASMIGPMQVVGRLGMMAIESRGSSSIAVGMLSFIFVGFASVALYFSGLGFFMIALFVVLQGAGYGVTSIIRPAITAEFIGTTDFGVISGFMATFSVAGFALAPTLASVIWAWSGYDAVLILTGLIALAGLAIFLAAARLAR